MRSESIGPCLVVADGSGTVVAENDDGADMAGFDSRIETTLEAGSTYTIWATSWQGNATGADTLTLDRASVRDGRTTPRAATSAARGPSPDGSRPT
jgi:hypothetical protein